MLNLEIKSVAFADVQTNISPVRIKEKRGQRFQTMIPSRTAHQVTASRFYVILPVLELI